MKLIKTIGLLFISGSLFAAAPVITPSVPTVYVSSSIPMSANQSVTWSMMSGSIGSVDPVTGIYTAPSTISAHNNWFGCQIFPNDDVFNTRIDALPVLTATNSYFHSNVSANIGFELDMPENLYTNATPTTNLVFANSGTNGAYQLLGFPDIRVENGMFTDSREVDQHILGVNNQTCNVTEFYKLYPIGDVGSGSCSTCNSGSGAKFSDNYNHTSSQGVDAAGLPVGPLALRYSELHACIVNGTPIQHALRFTLSNGVLSGTHVWPATAQASNSGSIPYGTRIRLAAATNISSFSTGAQCILTALKDYGAFMADGGISMHFQTMQDMTGDYTTFQIMTSELPNAFSASNFEVVDESSLEDTDANSPTEFSGRVTSTNTYVQPSNFSVVIASNTSTHQSSYMPVIVQPATVGASQVTGFNVMAGTPQTQLNVWVNGSTNTTVNCTMSPTLGSLTSGGLYTPPSSSINRSSTTVTCASQEDPNQSLSFPLVVYSTDGIRESLSNDTNVNYGPDVHGHKWFAGLSALWRLQGSSSCDWTSFNWTSVTDGGLYEHCEYVNSGSGDRMERFIVPNGQYVIKLLYGIGGSSAFSRGTWIDGVDTQGNIYSGSSASTVSGFGPWSELGVTGKQFDICDVTGSCAVQTAGTVTLSTQTVSNNNLYFAVRHLAPNGVTQPVSVLNAFSIEPVGSTVPIVTSALTAPGTVGNAFSYTITASSNPTSYNASGLPPGLSVNTATGLISGTPTLPGVTNALIWGINGNGAGPPSTLVITISGVPTRSTEVISGKVIIQGAVQLK